MSSLSGPDVGPNGGRNRTRTCDPIDVNDVLSPGHTKCRIQNDCSQSVKSLVFTGLCQLFCLLAGGFLRLFAVFISALNTVFIAVFKAFAHSLNTHPHGHIHHIRSRYEWLRFHPQGQIARPAGHTASQYPSRSRRSTDGCDACFRPALHN